MSSADFPQLARPAPWSCSCYIVAVERCIYPQAVRTYVRTYVRTFRRQKIIIFYEQRAGPRNVIFGTHTHADKFNSSTNFKQIVISSLTLTLTILFRIEYVLEVRTVLFRRRSHIWQTLLFP